VKIYFRNLNGIKPKMKILLLLTEIFNICNYVYFHIILFSALREVHGFFQSEFSTECDLVLPHVIYTTLSFVSGHPLAAYVFFLVFSSLLFFRLSSLQQCVLNITNPFSTPSFYCLYDVPLLDSL